MRPDPGSARQRTTSVVPGRGILAYPLALLLLLILCPARPSLAADATPSNRSHLRLPNGTLLVFEDQQAWKNAAICVLLVPPRGTPSCLLYTSDAADE